MLTFLRIIKFSLQDIARNLSLSIMTVLILVLMLLSINTLVIIRVITNQATVTVKEQIDMSIFFHPSADDKDIQSVRTLVQSFPEVTDLTYINKDEVLAQFKAEHADNKDILSSIDELGVNPLGATIVVKTRDTSDYKKIIDAITGPKYDAIIDGKTFTNTEKAVERIHTITSQVEQFSIVLSAFFAIIAFFIIFNTIRIAIYTQRVEIGIKRLVGANNWFIRGPYLFEALLFSLLSILLTATVVYFAIRFLDPYILAIFSIESFLTNYFSSHIIVLLSAEFLAVFFLTMATSLLAMRRYLRV
jgi:cell division transport system permease protein